MRLIILFLFCLCLFTTAAFAQSHAKWQATSPNSEQLLMEGFTVRTVTANNVTLKATAGIVGKRLQFIVHVTNGGDTPVDVQPQGFILQKSENKAFKQVEVEKVAREMEKKDSSEAGWLLAGTWYFLRDRQVTTPKTAGTVYSSAQADTLRRLALLANTINPKTTYAGVLFFEFDKGCKEVVLKMPINGTVFEIPFRNSEVVK